MFDNFELNRSYIDGRALSEKREILNQTQEEIAFNANVSQRKISQIENGESCLGALYKKAIEVNNCVRGYNQQFDYGIYSADYNNFIFDKLCETRWELYAQARFFGINCSADDKDQLEILLNFSELMKKYIEVYSPTDYEKIVFLELDCIEYKNTLARIERGEEFNSDDDNEKMIESKKLLLNQISKLENVPGYVLGEINFSISTHISTYDYQRLEYLDAAYRAFEAENKKDDYINYRLEECERLSALCYNESDEIKKGREKLLNALKINENIEDFSIHKNNESNIYYSLANNYYAEFRSNNEESVLRKCIESYTKYCKGRISIKKHAVSLIDYKKELRNAPKIFKTSIIKGIIYKEMLMVKVNAGFYLFSTYLYEHITSLCASLNLEEDYDVKELKKCFEEFCSVNKETKTKMGYD